MKESSFFLRTKLLPPRAALELLDRPRLTERLQANLSAPFTMVAADAGCGKTTLIADFVRNQSRSSVWYQMDHTDADPIVFLGYVAYGIKNIVPDFGDAIFPYLEEAKEEVLRFPERAADLLINEILESLEQPIILVLDDYHHIGRESIVHKLVDRVLQYSSDLLHLIITTRDLPPLAMMRRRSQSAALVLTRDDLLFTDEEVRQLFRQTLSVELEDAEIAEYRHRTHGWITALQLVRQVAAQSPASGPASRLDLGEILKRSEKDIFDYFAEEVLVREDRQTQNLLLYLSLLETLPLDLCSRLFPDFHCSAALPALAHKNVFLTVAGDGNSFEEYRLHPLFRAFLQRRLRSEIGQAGIAAERNRIADELLSNSQWELALPFLLEAQNYPRAAELIAEKGSEWIAAGAFSSLDEFSRQIPEEYLDRFPRALLHRAEIARIQGDIDDSSAILNRAVDLLQKQGDSAGEAEALHSLASLARRRGRPEQAYELLERAERLAAPDSETFLKCVNTRGLCMIADGAWADAEQQFRIALELAEKQGNDRYVRLVTHNLALPSGFRGDFGEALRWFKRIFRSDRPERPLPQEAIGHLNVARLHLYRGEFDECRKHLEKALELCQLYNLNFLRGEVFEAYANYYREKLDLAHAGEYYERARIAYEDAGIDVSTRELNEEKARFLIFQNDLAKARTLLEALIEARRRLKNERGVYTASAVCARVSLLQGQTLGLVEEVASIREYFHENNYYFDEALSSLLLAETLAATGGQKDAAEPLLRVLDLSARFDYDYWLRGEIRRAPELFRDEEIAERLPPDLRKELDPERAAASTPEVVAETSSSIVDLTINMLGPIEIHRDVSRPLASDVWTTRRARDIFCFIASSKHRRVPKDVLIETFWKDEDIETVEKNFHPTISHIRKALNSGQTLKQNFLLFRDGSYQLNPDLTYSLDTEEFDLAVANAEAAKRDKEPELFRRHLINAHNIYRGEYMQGVYEDWAEDRRNYYSEQITRVLAGLAKFHFAEKSYAKALQFANEIIAADPYREDMHRLVMKIFNAQGKPARVREQYESLQTLLRTDLGIEPAAETRRIFADLTNQPA
jgi:LuxR family maltose regulon positive regulatory protein